MRKKTMGWILTLIMVVAMILTGCTGAKAPAADEPAATEEVQATEAPVEKEEVVEEEAEPITLTWMDYNGYALDEFDTMMAAVEEAFGIKLEIQHSANDYTTILDTKINSGEAPDIFVNVSGADTDKYAEYSYDLSNESIIDKFMDWTLDACYSGNKLVGLPVNVETFGLIYNKDVLENAGITELPKTQSEMLVMCQELEAQGMPAFSNGYKEFWVLFNHQVSPFVMAEGYTNQEVYDKISSGELSFTTMKYFDNYLDFIDMSVKYGLPKPLETDWETEEVNGATGKAAMFHMGNWCEPVLVDANPDVRVGFLPMPIAEDPSLSRLSSNVSWIIKVGEESEHKDKAIQVIDYFLTSDAGLDYTVNKMGWVLTLKDNPLTPQGMLTASAQEINAEIAPYPFGLTVTPDGFTQQAGVILQNYVAGLVTRDEVKAELDALWADLME